MVLLYPRMSLLARKTCGRFEMTVSSAAMSVVFLSLQRLARFTLAAFVVTFVLARIVVLLIMTHRMPDLFLWVGGTHVHHLNYGIFLLVIVGGWALFDRPENPRTLRWLATAYGVGLALTFDEFGMWLHLGGGYWQRASYDAIVVVGAALSLIAVAPSMRHWPWTSWVIAGFIVLLCVIGLKLMSDELNLWQPFLERIESLGPVGS